MKKIIKTVSVILMLFMVFCVTACGKEEQAVEGTHASAEELVGKWSGVGGEISNLTLGSDGTYKDVAGDISVIGTYTVDPTSGILSVNESEYGLVINYSYGLDGNILTLQMDGGKERRFARM